jgi:hypothetical protein
MEESLCLRNGDKQAGPRFLWVSTKIPRLIEEQSQVC